MDQRLHLVLTGVQLWTVRVDQLALQHPSMYPMAGLARSLSTVTEQVWLEVSDHLTLILDPHYRVIGQILSSISLDCGQQSPGLLMVLLICLSSCGVGYVFTDQCLTPGQPSMQTIYCHMEKTITNRESRCLNGILTNQVTIAIHSAMCTIHSLSSNFHLHFSERNFPIDLCSPCFFFTKGMSSYFLIGIGFLHNGIS